MNIKRCEETTEINVKTYYAYKVLWVFDLDETLLIHKDNKAHPFNESLVTWINDLYATGHAIVFLTARYHQPEEVEREVLEILKLPYEKDSIYTRSHRVRLFNYTSGNLKGKYFRDIIQQYELDKLYFDAIFFFDDRITQIMDVIDYNKHLTNLWGIWIRKYSYEKALYK